MFPGLAQNMKETYVFFNNYDPGQFLEMGSMRHQIHLYQIIVTTHSIAWMVSLNVFNKLIYNEHCTIYFLFWRVFSDHIDPLHSLSGGTIRQIKTCFNIENPFPERYPYFRSMAIKDFLNCMENKSNWICEIKLLSSVFKLMYWKYDFSDRNYVNVQNKKNCLSFNTEYVNII